MKAYKIFLAKFTQAITLTVLVTTSNWVLAEAEETGIVLKQPLKPVDPISPVSGEAQECLQSRQVRTIEVLNDQLVILQGSHKRYWVNQLPTTCIGLDDKKILKLESFGSKICRNDRFEATEPFGVGSFVAECRWGSFEPAVLEQIAVIKSELKKS